MKHNHRFVLALVLMFAAVGGYAVAQTQMAPAMPTGRAESPQKQAEPPLKQAFASWDAGDYPAALVEFEKLVKADPDNMRLWADMASHAVSKVSRKHTQLLLEQLRAKQASERAAKQEAPVAARAEGDAPAALPRGGVVAAVPAGGSSAAQPQRLPKSPEEIAKLEKDWNDANAAVAQLEQVYERQQKENPAKAAIPYAMSFFYGHAHDLAKREQLLLKAVALDPKLTDAYSRLASLASTYFSDEAAVEYAKKALDTNPGDTRLRDAYESALWSLDPAAARKLILDELAAKAGTPAGADVLVRLIVKSGDRAERVALLQRYRREYPNRLREYPNGSLAAALSDRYYSDLLNTDPAEALSFAQPILKVATTDAQKKAWQAKVAFAQAMVETRSLAAHNKFAEAAALLERSKLPPGVKDFLPLTFAKAQAADGAGDTAKAYEMIAALLVKAPDDTVQSALLKYGAKLGKNPQQVDEDVWSRRMQNAPQFKEFELRKLGGKESVKLADLRGKVVMVDFWFPG